MGKKVDKAISAKLWKMKFEAVAYTKSLENDFNFNVQNLSAVDKLFIFKDLLKKLVEEATVDNYKSKYFINIYNGVSNCTNQLSFDYIDKDIKDCILEIIELFKEYCKRSNVEPVREMDDYIKGVPEFFSDNVISKKEPEEVPIQGEPENIPIPAEPEESKRKKSLDKSLKKKNEQLDKLTEELVQFKAELKDRKKAITDLERENLSLKKQLEKAQAHNEKISEEFNDAKNKVSELEGTNKTLVHENRNNSILISELQSYKTKILLQASIAERILYKLLEGGEQSYFQLYALFANEDITYDDFNQALSILKLKYDVQVSSQQKGVNYYKICTSPLKRQTFQITSGNACYDMLLVSDLHIKEYSRPTLNKLDLINQYCVDNGIRTIIDLGDLLDLEYSGNKIENTKRIIDETITKYPQVKGISHFILGGNHDYRGIDSHMDPLSLISKERADLVSLGYNSAVLKVNSSRIGLHHCEKADKQLDDILYRTGLNPELQAYLNQFYSSYDIKESQIFINLFGHYHIEKIDFINHIFMLDSARVDLNAARMYHVKFTFNSLNQIDQMLIIPVQIKTNRREGSYNYTRQMKPTY